MANTSAELAITCLEGFQQSWVLFTHGTVVIVPNALDESLVKEEAITILKEYGPVFAGSSHGDFTVSDLQKQPGWLVSSHHSGIFTFVGHDAVEVGATDFIIGMFGRNNRDLDSRELNIVSVHVHTAA